MLLTNVLLLTEINSVGVNVYPGNYEQKRHRDSQLTHLLYWLIQTDFLVCFRRHVVYVYACRLYRRTYGCC